eukprot:2872223-Rhodomonas_salina.1
MKGLLRGSENASDGYMFWNLLGSAQDLRLACYLRACVRQKTKRKKKKDRRYLHDHLSKIKRKGGGKGGRGKHSVEFVVFEDGDADGLEAGPVGAVHT